MAEKIQSNLLSEDNLDSLRTLVPGDTVDLQIAMPAAPKRVKTDYIGMLIDECLLFHIPTSAKWITVRDALTVGNDIVVRSVLEGDTGQVIAFKVKVLKSFKDPLSRQVYEGIYIRRQDTASLNTKQDYYQASSYRMNREVNHG